MTMPSIPVSYTHLDVYKRQIYAFLEDYTGDRVCSKQLYAEALGNANIPAEWETRAICEIKMCIRDSAKAKRGNPRWNN